MIARKLSGGLALGAAAAAIYLLCVSGSAADATATCAAKIPTTVTSARTGANAMLVPASPTHVLLCRYGGLNDMPRLGLLGSKDLVDQPTVASLATELNNLPAGPSGPVACPADDGSGFVAYFSYGSGPVDPVGIAETGCGTVSNGLVSRIESTSDLVPRLRALVPVKTAPPPPRNATITGFIRLCGGPAPGRCWIGTIGSCSPGAGCTTTDRVAVYDVHGNHVAGARLRHARFTVKVPAGHYVVRLLADGPRVHGRVIATQRVKAPAAQTSTVAFRFAVP